MPVLVTIPGTTENQGWPAATHYVVDPQAVLHVYNGDKLVTSYKAWDQVVVQDALTLKQNVSTFNISAGTDAGRSDVHATFESVGAEDVARHVADIQQRARMIANSGPYTA